MSTKGAINFEDTTFRVLYSCFALLALKTLLMSLLTAKTRFSKKVVANHEDSALLKNAKVRFNDPDVERVRRAHLNDLENIIVFVFTSFWYVALKPNPFVAIPLILAYTAARYAHTYVYAVKVVKQPARFICYAIGYVINAYMALTVVLTFKD